MDFAQLFVSFFSYPHFTQSCCCLILLGAPSPREPPGQGEGRERVNRCQQMWMWKEIELLFAACVSDLSLAVISVDLFDCQEGKKKSGKQ